jgi:hypothetical protein
MDPTTDLPEPSAQQPVQSDSDSPELAKRPSRALGVLSGAVAGAVCRPLAFYYYRQAPVAADELQFVMLIESVIGLVTGAITGWFASAVGTIFGGFISGAVFGALASGFSLPFLCAVSHWPKGPPVTGLYWLCAVMGAGAVAGGVGGLVGNRRSLP